MTSKLKHLALFTLLVIPLFTLHAAECDPKLGYCPLTSIPQLVNSTGNVDINTYIPKVVALVIAIAGGLAVLRIIIGGIQYMSTDAFSGKSSAKETIQNALIGLLLAISAYTILNTINPNLVKLDLTLQNVKQSGNITPPPIGGDATISSDYDCGFNPDNPDCKSKTVINNDGTTMQCSDEEPCLRGVIPCDNCTAIFANGPIHSKSPSQGGCHGNGPCMVSFDLFHKLILIRTDTNSTAANSPYVAARDKWQVQNMYPPPKLTTNQGQSTGVTQHATCLDTGTCLEVALTDTWQNSHTLVENWLAETEAFFKASEHAGLWSSDYSFTYVICPNTELSAAKSAITSKGDAYMKGNISKFSCNLDLNLTGVGTGETALPEHIEIKKK